MKLSLFPSRPRGPRSHLWAFVPGRRPYRVERRDGVWWWSDTSGSHPQSALREQVEALGGHVERKPADWRPQA